MSFVHLHLHSQYSMLEATCRFQSVVQKARDMGMPAVAVTDYGNMFGAVEFYFAAQAAQIKPIIGLEAYIAPGSRFEKQSDRDSHKPNRRLVLLAENIEGYRSLCQISSKGYKEGFYYRPRIDYEVLREHNNGVIALSGGIMGEVPWTFEAFGPDRAFAKVQELAEIYPESFYLEISRTGAKGEEALNQFLIETSEKLSLPLVATNNVHYLQGGEQIAQEVLICIGSNKTLHDESRFRLPSQQYFFKSPKQMRALFKDIPQACDNTLKVAERCNVEFKLTDQEGKPIYHLPSFPTKGGVSTREEMRRITFEGLEQRLQESAHRGEPVDEEGKKRYHERLDYELGVIESMGFNGYFLIVQDFIGWAKDNDIPVGPGRGSGAGSLVAYCLRITDLDPMPYNLIFERFLNPERVSMPDFDIDFCQENRQRVIEYVTEKYGEDSVSQIITYGKLQARAAIRDVGRVMGMTYGEVDVVAKLIPDKLGITLGEAIDSEERLRELMESDPKVNTLMDLAQKIEGLVRHAGIHAAGVVIADGRIVDHAPLYRGVEGENVVQYDMKHAEKIGLIKFDFLGLKTLTHIHDAFRLVEANRGKKLSTSDISLKDPGIYSLMSKGDTAGVFQFEGEGITDLLRKVKPTCFEDIVACNALYRPGPMEMIPEYLERRAKPTKVKYLFPELEPILSETFGIVVYQEHVQLIAAKIANYSLGEADMLRRAMGKKIAEEMAKQRQRFMDGAEGCGFDSSKAAELFDTMAEFAKYGFNKSHAAAYCVVAAQTAYLKNYYPVEFFAALLSTEMSDTDKVVKYVKDAKKHGIEVLPPHINKSKYKFTVDGDRIFFSLGAIKGVGQAAVEALLEARKTCESEGFASLEEFFDKVDLRRVNKKTIECLIKAGAFDGFGASRAQLMKGYIKYIERADQIRKDRELGQASLFAMDQDVADQEKVRLEECSPWKRSFRLANEKEVLGFYLSDHPLKGMEELTGVWSSSTVMGLSEQSPKTQVRVLGLISTMREIITKKGTRMAFAQLEDLTGAVELVIFPNAFADAEIKLKGEQALLVTGTLEKNEDACKILVDKVEKVDELFSRAKGLVMKLDLAMQSRMDELKGVLEKYPGDSHVQLEVDVPEVRQVVAMRLTDPKGVRLSNDFFEGLQEVIEGTSTHLRLQV